MSAPAWWIARVTQLSTEDAAPLALGALWNLSQRLLFVRDNVDPRHLELDFARGGGARQAWATFERQEADVAARLGGASAALAGRVKRGELGRAAFRDSWETLGFVAQDGGSGTPADDYLDGLLHLPRLAYAAAPTAHGHLNLSSRASRVADFLTVARPGAADVVFDLGSGSGKLAVTVGASVDTTVHGVEFEGAYVTEARGSAERLGLSRVTFAAADVRDADLTAGSIFFLYYPFHGPVAREVATRLGALARQKDLTIYASGAQREFGEFFLAQVANGAMALAETRGEFGEVMVLRSQRA